MLAINTTYSRCDYAGGPPAQCFKWLKKPLARIAEQLLANDYMISPGTPSAHGNWRARDDSNVRTLPQEPAPTSNRAKSGPLPLTGVSSIEADRRP
jgi:hypothetical protein